jgi:hypothetical protein
MPAWVTVNLTVHDRYLPGLELRLASARCRQKLVTLVRAGPPGERNLKMKTKVIVTTSDLPPEVIRAIKLGKKIEAIKLLRDATGLGLANAKVLVDKAAREQGTKKTMPGLADEQANLGRLLKLLLVVVVAYGCYSYFVAI